MSEDFNKFEMQIRLEREDAIPAFAAFLRCEAQHHESPVIILNVQSLMSPQFVNELGMPIDFPKEERIRCLIECMMHEFGHALESYFQLPANEEAVNEAQDNWEAAFLQAEEDQKELDLAEWKKWKENKGIEPESGEAYLTRMQMETAEQLAAVFKLQNYLQEIQDIACRNLEEESTAEIYNITMEALKQTAHGRLVPDEDTRSEE